MNDDNSDTTQHKERLVRIRKALKRGRLPTIQDIDALLLRADTELSLTAFDYDERFILVASAYTTAVRKMRARGRRRLPESGTPQ